MIKRVIFDLDNTLIMWKDEYLCALEKTIKKHNKNLNKNTINDLIESYENNHEYYDKTLLMDYINSNIDETITMEFIDDFLYNIGFCSDIDDDVIEILDYLKTKYELVVLTNWFTEPQTKRLEHVDIRKYFKEIYGAEKYSKPNKSSFFLACGNHKPEECVMIGDNYDIDIIGANNIGMNTIYYNYKNKQNNKLKLIEIDNIKMLKDIL